MTVRGLIMLGFRSWTSGLPQITLIDFRTGSFGAASGTVVHENDIAHVVIQPVPATCQERGVHEGLSEVARSAASNV